MKRRSGEGVCTVSTVRDTGPRLASFIRYHLAIGVRRIYLFFDAPADPGIAVARRFERVTAVLPSVALRRRQRTQRTWKRLGPLVDVPGPAGLIARQKLNAETAIAMALDEGLGWIVHLDDDELLSVGRSVDRYFGALPGDVGQVIHLNHEAAPESAHVVDPFREVTLFKRHRRWLHDHGETRALDVLSAFWRSYYFVAHMKGKAAGRVAPGLSPAGVHAFTPSPAHPTSVWAPGDACILHYAFSSLPPLVRRYARWRRHALHATQPSRDGRSPFYDFMLRAMTVYAHTGAAGLELLHEKCVVYSDPKEISLLLRAGAMKRIELPSQLLAEQRR